MQGVPIEQMTELWKSHWLWSRVVAKDASRDHASEMGVVVLSNGGKAPAANSAA